MDLNGAVLARLASYNINRYCCYTKSSDGSQKCFMRGIKQSTRILKVNCYLKAYNVHLHVSIVNFGIRTDPSF